MRPVPDKVMGEVAEAAAELLERHSLEPWHGGILPQVVAEASYGGSSAITADLAVWRPPRPYRRASRAAAQRGRGRAVLSGIELPAGATVEVAAAVLSALLAYPSVGGPPAGSDPARPRGPAAVARLEELVASP
jgi:hypothetical protein